MFGRLPWLAVFFFRSRFLRPRLDTTSCLSVRFCAIDGRLIAVVGECVTVRHDVADRGRSPWLDNRAECRGGRFMIEEIRAEMVANVWKIMVAEGDAVSAGDTLMILESMKMEIPVLSEVEGTVAKLAVSEGAVVQQGDLIAVVE